MIHEPWVLAVGDQYDLREIADVLEKISGNMVDIYASESGIGKKEVKAMLKAETWFTAKEAKEKGFIDTIIDGKAAKAQFDLSMFANVPDDLTTQYGEDPEKDKRMIEKALRDVGFSQNSAKAFIARGLKAESASEDVILSAQKTLRIIQGGK